MPHNESLPLHDVLQALRQDIQAEDTLIASRVTWYVTSQAFLLTAYATSWGAGFEWPIFFHAVLPLAAIILSALIFASIYAATWAQDVYLREQAALVARIKIKSRARGLTMNTLFRQGRTLLMLKAVVLVAATALLAGCVTPLPIERTAPDLSYKVTRPVTITVIDTRDVLADGKPATYVGKAHGVFGIPADLQVYPVLTQDKTKKSQTLAQNLQERIAVGLNDEGWRMTPATFPKVPLKDEIASLATANGTERVIVLTLKTWYFSINLNLVSDFNFDWGYNLHIFDAQGATLADLTDNGRDVVDTKGSDSYGNQVNLAYRDRLIKIFERPEVKAALQ